MAQQTKKELVRLLSIEHGYKRASELANVDYAVVRQWAVRGNWKQKPNPSQIVTNAADALATFLQSNEKRTRWSLSRAHRLQAAKAARGKLGPKETLQVAQGAAITHGWKTQEAGQTQVAVNIAILDSAPVT